MLQLGPTGNLGDLIMCDDPHEGLVYSLRGQGGPPARRAVPPGNQRAQHGVVPLRIGEWNRAAAVVEVAVEEDGLGDFADVGRAAGLVTALRGDGRRAREVLPEDEGADEDPQELAYHDYALAAVCVTEGDLDAALRHARRAAEVLQAPTMDPFVVVWPVAVRAAHGLGDRAALDDLLALLDGRYDGELPVLVRAERRLAVARLVEDAEGRVAAVEDAVTELRAVGWPYHLALGLLDLAEAQLLAGKDPADVVAEAATIGSVLGSPQISSRAERLAGG